MNRDAHGRVAMPSIESVFSHLLGVSEADMHENVAELKVFVRSACNSIANEGFADLISVWFAVQFRSLPI